AELHLLPRVGHHVVLARGVRLPPRARERPRLGAVGDLPRLHAPGPADQAVHQPGPLDAQDAGVPAADQEAAGEVQERPHEARGGDAEAPEGARRQPAGRLPAAAGAAAGLHRPVPRAARLPAQLPLQLRLRPRRHRVVHQRRHLRRQAERGDRRRHAVAGHLLVQLRRVPGPRHPGGAAADDPGGGRDPLHGPRLAAAPEPGGRREPAGGDHGQDHHVGVPGRPAGLRRVLPHRDPDLLPEPEQLDARAAVPHLPQDRPRGGGQARAGARAARRPGAPSGPEAAAPAPPRRCDARDRRRHRHRRGRRRGPRRARPGRRPAGRWVRGRVEEGFGSPRPRQGRAVARRRWRSAPGLGASRTGQGRPGRRQRVGPGRWQGLGRRGQRLPRCERVQRLEGLREGRPARLLGPGQAPQEEEV
ncbi:MAG: Inner membrane protein translocase and chaperone YidC, short form OxaI-like, partial [uncultured Actinomycetospora sp.]